MGAEARVLSDRAVHIAAARMTECPHHSVSVSGARAVLAVEVANAVRGPRFVNLQLTTELNYASSRPLQDAGVRGDVVQYGHMSDGLRCRSQNGQAAGRTTRYNDII